MGVSSPAHPPPPLWPQSLALSYSRSSCTISLAFGTISLAFGTSSFSPCRCCAYCPIYSLVPSISDLSFRLFLPIPRSSARPPSAASGSRQDIVGPASVVGLPACPVDALIQFRIHLDASICLPPTTLCSTECSIYCLTPFLPRFSASLSYPQQASHHPEAPPESNESTRSDSVGCCLAPTQLSEHFSRIALAPLCPSRPYSS